MLFLVHTIFPRSNEEQSGESYSIFNGMRRVAKAAALAERENCSDNQLSHQQQAHRPEGKPEYK